MKCVVFLPGIMGSELRNPVIDKRIWPPKFTDIIRKSVDVEELLSPDLVAIKPIEAVARFYPVYRSIRKDIEACGYTTDGLQRRFIPFAYDWRKPNEVSAQALSDHLNLQDEFDEIVFIGHSMGGLVLRYLLESGEFEQQPWFNKVTQLITLGTPHFGAAAALKQVAGLDSNLGLTAAKVKTLVSDTRYPSAYQLVSPSGTAITLRSASQEQLPVQLNPFDQALVAKYGLVDANIEASQNFWSKLDVSRKPARVNYFSFVGSAHNTKYRLDWNGVDLVERTANDSGDGTVPVASCINTFIPHAFSQKKHAAIFQDRNLRIDLYKMLGAPAGVSPHSAPTSITAFDAPTAIGLSTDREEYLPVDEMEVVVSYKQPHSNPTFRFQIVMLDEESDDGTDVEFAGEPMTIRFDGANLSSFKFTTTIDLQPGVYELRTAEDVDDPERTLFIVADEE